MRSDDGGVTWKDVTPRLGPFTPTLGTGDPYVYVDPFSGRLFHSLLLGFQCTTISFSDDAGESWVTNPLGCGLPPSVPLHDHQTIFSGKHRTLPPVGYPAVVYYCVNRVVDTACATSLNGGVTFGPLRPAIYLGLDPSAGVPGNQSATLDGICSGLTAHGVAAPDGTVYLARGWCGLPLVAVSRDDGLTWETTLVSPTLRMDRLDHDLNIAVDEAGNAYAFFRGEDGQAYLSVSTDGGRTWREPLNVTPPGVTAVDFPTAAAGAEGRLALAFYGTTEEAHYSGFSDEATWNVYLTVTTDGLAANPLFTTVSMNDPANPVVRGACAKHDGCHGVGDFIDSVIDAEGRPWVAFVDVCEGACAEPTGKENTARGEGEGIGVVGTLAEGPRLRGVMGPLPP
ncbi:MAG TPA: sialidase family protein [Candidatus Thermoplasmatota archaeon]|nr:sialidase family protein [Candidatus Thermoplasmatota archaeon]